MGNSEFQPVRVVIDPYSHESVQQLLKKTYQEFGRDRSRWYWRYDQSSEDANILTDTGGKWPILFYFQNPHDAVIFSLKYSQ